MGKLGKKNILNASFGVRLEQGTRRPRDLFPDQRTNSRWLVILVVLVIFLLLGAGRLIELQLIKGDYYQALADGNRVRRIPLKAPRGEILARDSSPLARNVPVYKLAKFSEGGVVIETQVISREEALRIQAEDLEDVNRLIIDIGREYPLGEAAAHVVGYVNEANPDEVNRQLGCGESKIPQPTTHNLSLQLGDLVGRMGVEAYYDCILRGVNGEELIEVDARGKLVRRLGRREPVLGRSMVLSLDPKLQQASFTYLQEALNERGMATRRESGLSVKAASVAQNPETGEILALVSVPSFNPHTLKEDYPKLVQDENLPFFNRAIGGAYHPGSTFKLVTTVAGVESGQIDRNFEYEDKGFVELGGITFRNWLYVKRGRTEGKINIVRAIVRSTDTFFYIAGEKIGITRLAEWANAFNLGRETGIDLPGEIGGLVPTPQWKEKAKGERWYLGNTYNVAIGQGDLTASPVQVNAMTSAIATNRWCRPHLLKEVGISNCRDVGISEEALQLIKEGMVGACSTGGTAGVFFNYNPKGGRVACKTGTAQFSGGLETSTHAWFTAYGAVGDSINPEVVVTVLVEEGGEGSVVAAPIAKKIFEEWFGRD